MPRPTRWKGCVNGLKGRVRACFICPPIRLTSTPSKWPAPKLSSSCARLKRALWKHSMRRLLRPYKLFLRAMLKASSSMSDSVYDPYGNRYNNESGWYEGWMIHDLVVPPVLPPRPDPDGHAQFGTMTQADAKAIKAKGSHNNIPGHLFTVDGKAPRFPRATDQFPKRQSNVVPIFLSMGAWNSLQQSD